MRTSHNLFLALLLTACALLGCAGLTKPQTFDQKLAYAYGQVTAVRTTATDYLNRGRITVEQAALVQEKANEARGYLDLARAAPDPKEAESKLTLAVTILTALEASLRRTQ